MSLSSLFRLTNKLEPFTLSTKSQEQNVHVSKKKQIPAKLSAGGRARYLGDNRDTHVSHVGNDVTVLWWDVGMLEELAQVFLCDTWHAQMTHKNMQHAANTCMRATT